MKFIDKGTTGKHENYTLENFYNRSWYNENAIGDRKYFVPHIQDFTTDDGKKNLRLETNWGYLLFSESRQVYEFHSYYRHEIVDPNTPYSEHDIRTIIHRTHNEFQMSFDEKRTEHQMFKAIPNLTLSMEDKVVLQISVLLDKMNGA